MNAIALLGKYITIPAGTRSVELTIGEDGNPVAVFTVDAPPQTVDAIAKVSSIVGVEQIIEARVDEADA